MTERYGAEAGSPSAVVRRPLPVDDPQRRRPDIARAGRRLGWAPRVALEQGLEATIARFAREVAPRERARPGPLAAAAV